MASARRAPTSLRILLAVVGAQPHSSFLPGCRGFRDGPARPLLGTAPLDGDLLPPLLIVRRLFVDAFAQLPLVHSVPAAAPPPQTRPQDDAVAKAPSLVSAGSNPKMWQPAALRRDFLSGFWGAALAPVLRLVVALADYELFA